MDNWQPTATIERLRQRAAILQQVRDFFLQRNVLEVETPALSQGTVSDVHLDALTSDHILPGQPQPTRLYLQTSPEYAMKRLLADGYPDIYQICKCFREDEIGRLHNPEFTMLEWYRRDFSMHQLIDEVGALLVSVLGVNNITQSTYQSLFLRFLDVDPLSSDLALLVKRCSENGLQEYAQQLTQLYDSGTNALVEPLKDALLQVLFNQCIEPYIGQDVPMCVSHFPASQAALACLANDGKTALRFEFYYKGLELANGFEELTDAKAQLARFESDNLIREHLNKPSRPIDLRFLKALESGLPPCAGVALGIDRLIMLALNCEHINEVISFDITRA
ncbi:elongation factor P--(R)-beta-lysine ligase [Glaciecola sp. XM2]|uniref:elongation factor P--(R)-beta-lysine ligase n=1 Tax=Glaciecola sp. XM2 TaxID=1914931 RepID=UPI001BDEA023|nr:elongation factor P--(R)-beta-lysine ligase [Glaciecola sp. XM2]MBT1450322.1 elongation factor P--(R)-beta-lysine ligase [Glaciecola sp. XM2]